MSKITDAFNNKKAFISFLTAGYPSKEDTIQNILAMGEAGADIVEIGIPFSDPIAEGPVIQHANVEALVNGLTTDDAFDIVKEVRKLSEIPLVFLTYINPVFYYGYEKFFKQCKLIGVNGIIIPDLPYEEKDEIAKIAKENNVDVISLIAPTSKQRIKIIAKDAEGFIYLVSSMGVTGVRSEITTDLQEIINEIRKVTEIPVSVGFGISTLQQAKEISKIADGVIVGSAIIKIIEKHSANSRDHIFNYTKEMKDAISN
ncbi:MAG: tryptophan synthase subunit alpha [Methanobrevibacter sp.]|nr:tryptophan synthase subunit alpha [Methanobrevibacter sp.]